MVASAALMNPLMARCAERHQIALVMRATVRDWTNVMHKRRKDISSLLFALLTKRMSRQVTVTNASPCAAVSLVLIVAAHEVVVMPLHRFLVRLAVAAFSVRKVRATRHTAGALRFSRHHFTSITA